MALSASACRAVVTVDIDIDETSGGLITVTVEVDDEVIGWAPNWTRQIETTDLIEAGWSVLTPSQLEPSLTSELLAQRIFGVSKPFRSDAELRAILGEVDGGLELFSDSQLSANYLEATAEFDYSVKLNLDFELADLIDERVANLFGGNLYGVPIDELERRAGKPLDSTVGLVVRARFPSASVRLPAAGEHRLDEGGERVLRISSVHTDQDLVRAIEASSLESDEVRRALVLAVLLWVALAAVAVLLVYLLARHRRIAKARRQLASRMPPRLWS